MGRMLGRQRIIAHVCACVPPLANSVGELLGAWRMPAGLSGQSAGMFCGRSSLLGAQASALSAKLASLSPVHQAACPLALPPSAARLSLASTCDACGPAFPPSFVCFASFPRLPPLPPWPLLQIGMVMTRLCWSWTLSPLGRTSPRSLCRQARPKGLPVGQQAHPTCSRCSPHTRAVVEGGQHFKRLSFWPGSVMQ